jgi:hypothetical protein
MVGSTSYVALNVNVRDNVEVKTVHVNHRLRRGAPLLPSYSTGIGSRSRSSARSSRGESRVGSLLRVTPCGRVASY